MLSFASSAKTNGNAFEAFLAFIPPGLKGGGGFPKGPVGPEVFHLLNKSRVFKKGGVKFPPTGPSRLRHRNGAYQEDSRMV